MTNAAADLHGSSERYRNSSMQLKETVRLRYFWEATRPPASAILGSRARGLLTYIFAAYFQQAEERLGLFILACNDLAMMTQK
jgi:hypothetical protein